MSELKATTVYDAYWKATINGDSSILVYLKSEADKVIADKDKEIAKLKEECRWRKFPDEKPEWGKEVLVVDDESKHHIVRFSHDMKWISWGKMNTCESNCALYWMPLPEKPKDDKFKEAK